MNTTFQAGPRWTFGIWIHAADAGFGDWLRDIHGHIVRLLDQEAALARLTAAGYRPSYNASDSRSAYVGHVAPEAK